MRHDLSTILCLLLILPFSASCKKSSGGSATDNPQSSDLAADVELVQNLGLLSTDMDSALAVKGTLKVRNTVAGSQTKIEINGASDDCDVYLRETEPFDGTVWNILVVQSYFYTGTMTSCERIVTITRLSDGKSISKKLVFNLGGSDGNTVTDNPSDGGTDDDNDNDTGGRDPLPDAPTDPSSPGSMEMCMGSSTPCGLRMDMSSCWAGGCYWSSMTNSCSGSATPCYVLSTKSSCLAIMGCLWQ